MKPTAIHYASFPFFDSTREDGKQFPTRPEAGISFFGRLWAAWLVFTGQADALMWREEVERWKTYATNRKTS